MLLSNQMLLPTNTSVLIGFNLTMFTNHTPPRHSYVAREPCPIRTPWNVCGLFSRQSKLTLLPVSAAQGAEKMDETLTGQTIFVDVGDQVYGLADEEEVVMEIVDMQPKVVVDQTTDETLQELVCQPDIVASERDFRSSGERSSEKEKKEKSRRKSGTTVKISAMEKSAETSSTYYSEMLNIQVRNEQRQCEGHALKIEHPVST